MASRSNTLSPEALECVRAELRGCPRGERTDRIARAAESYGCSPATLYRALAVEHSERRTRKSAPKIPELGGWTETLVGMALKSPKRNVPLEQCLEAALASDLLPPEAGNIPIATYYRRARELGLRDSESRSVRLWAEVANQAWQFDASTSEYFSVLRQLDDGDYLLRLNRKVHPIYKNKPLAKERLRVQVYSVWDMHSGAQLSRYHCARGENAFDALDFLCWAAEPKVDRRIPIEGLPVDLWADQGPVTKLEAAKDLLARLNVEVKVGTPDNKKRQGGVERTHRSRWSGFEAQFFLYLGERERLEITLSDLNARLVEWLVRINGKSARYQPSLSRTAAWVRSINQQGGVRAIPPNAMETLAREARRWVDEAGIFQWDNILYQVDGIYRRHVVARRSLTDGRVIAEAIDTGERYDARPWNPPKYGEFRGLPATPAEQARKAGGGLKATTELYQPEGAGNVVAFGPRRQPAADLPDPMDASRYRTPGEAMARFLEIYGLPLPPADLTAIRELLTERGNDKDYTRSLALELRSAVEAQR